MGSQAFSDSFEQEIIQHYFRNVAKGHATGANIYVALSTATTGSAEAWTGAAMNEAPNSNGYARATISFHTGSAGVATNDIAVVFTCNTSAWPQVQSMAIVDSATHGAGNVLMYDDITPATLNPGDTLTFAAGQVTLTMT